MVDRERATIPCRGVESRAHPLQHLAFLEPCVRAFVVPRVVIVGKRSVEVEALSDHRRYAHTFVTDVDIPFVQDGLRDGESIRTSMHGLFIERLGRAGQPFTVVRGDVDARVQAAVAVIDEILAAVRF